MGMNDVRVERDPNAIIGNFDPRDTDDRFKTPRTIYLARGYEESSLWGITVEYSDRLRAQHGARHEKAWKASRSSGLVINSANQVQSYLRLLLKKPSLMLVMIKASFDPSGYSIQEFYYIDVK